MSRRETAHGGAHRRRWNLAALAFLLIVFIFAFVINLPA